MILSFFHDTTGGIHMLAETSWDGSDLMQWINHQQWKRNRRCSDQRKWNLFPSLLNIIPRGQSPNHGILDLPFMSVKSVAWSACVNRVAESKAGGPDFWLSIFPASDACPLGWSGHSFHGLPLRSILVLLGLHKAPTSKISLTSTCVHQNFPCPLSYHFQVLHPAECDVTFNKRICLTIKCKQVTIQNNTCVLLVGLVKKMPEHKGVSLMGESQDLWQERMKLV